MAFCQNLAGSVHLFARVTQSIDGNVGYVVGVTSFMLRSSSFCGITYCRSGLRLRLRFRLRIRLRIRLSVAYLGLGLGIGYC